MAKKKTPPRPIYTPAAARPEPAAVGTRSVRVSCPSLFVRSTGRIYSAGATIELPAPKAGALIRAGHVEPADGDQPAADRPADQP